MLKAKACIMPTLRMGNSSIKTRLSLTAGKSYADTPVDRICFERFERDTRIAEISVPEFVEVIDADIDVDSAAPIGLHAFVHNVAPGRKLLDAVSTAGERRLERGCANIALLAVDVGAFPPVLGQDGKLADDLRQLAVARPVESEGYLAITGLLDRDDVAVIGRLLRTVFLESLERENH